MHPHKRPLTILAYGTAASQRRPSAPTPFGADPTQCATPTPRPTPHLPLHLSHPPSPPRPLRRDGSRVRHHRPGRAARRPAARGQARMLRSHRAPRGGPLRPSRQHHGDLAERRLDHPQYPQRRGSEELDIAGLYGGLGGGTIIVYTAFPNRPTLPTYYPIPPPPKALVPGVCPIRASFQGCLLGPRAASHTVHTCTQWQCPTHDAVVSLALRSLAASSPALTRFAKVVATLFDAEGKSHGPHAFLMDLRRGGRLVDGGKVIACGFLNKADHTHACANPRHTLLNRTCVVSAAT